MFQYLSITGKLWTAYTHAVCVHSKQCVRYPMLSVLCSLREAVNPVGGRPETASIEVKYEERYCRAAKREPEEEDRMEGWDREEDSEGTGRNSTWPIEWLRACRTYGRPGGRRGPASLSPASTNLCELRFSMGSPCRDRRDIRLGAEERHTHRCLSVLVSGHSSHSVSEII